MMSHPLPPQPNWSKILRPGQRIFLGSGAACPLQLVESFLPHTSSVGDIELIQTLTLGHAPWTDPRYHDHLKVNAFYLDPRLSDLVNAGIEDYTPAHLSEIPNLFREHVIPIDIALISVSPPDAYGYCSFGPQVELNPAVTETVSMIIAQINPALPRCHGLSFIHISEIDYAITAEAPLPQWILPKLETTDLRIGAYVAQLIEDGDTIQIGISPIGQSILNNLRDHRHLGIHSETISDGVQKLFENGVIDNSCKTLLPGKIITSKALGTTAHYQFLHDNPHIDFRPSDFVNNPLVIARNDRMVAVHNALKVDLTGQPVVDSLQGRFRAGLGSQSDFLRGASLSKKGRPIIALRAAEKDANGKLISNITSQLPAGAGVAINRADVHYIVTEYGVATLRGRTVQERATEIIQVAHPDFREELLKSAAKQNLVPRYFQLPPPYEDQSEDIQIRKIRLRDEHDYILRPLTPADDRRLQDFFYSHTKETITRRYGFSITRMSRERAFELVGIDQNIDLGLALIELQGPRQVIHGVGRYYLDRNQTSAEVAFVVSEKKRRTGIARALLERMIEIGRKRNLKTLWAQVDRDNIPMLKLFRQYNATELTGEDNHTTRIEIELKAARLTGIALPPKHHFSEP